MPIPETDWVQLAAARLPARLLAKINQVGPVPDYRPDLGPCWLWIGACEPQEGYGRAWDPARRRTVHAHRLVLELVTGPLSAGLEPDHLCRVRPCVNPAHLEAVTHAENVRRATEAGVGWGAVQAAKTECPEGHPYDEIDGQGFRRCGRCRRRHGRERSRRYRERRRASVAAGG